MSRIITAVIVLPFLIASILLPQLYVLFIVLAAVAMMLGLHEFYILARKKDLKPEVTAGFLSAAALFTVFCFANNRGERLDVQTLLLVVILMTIATFTAVTLRGAPFDKM